MITIKQTGDFSKLDSYLEKLLEIAKFGKLDKYGREGVEALASATPKDTGVTAASWSYEIERNGDDISIVYSNSNVNDGVNIAVILQYGHGTGTGGYVVGRDYINPAIRPLFDRIADEAWKEVKEA